MVKKYPKKIVAATDVEREVDEDDVMSNEEHKKQRSGQKRSNTNFFMLTRSQKSNISIELPFNVHANNPDDEEIDNNNIFLQTPVLKLKIEKSLREISMDINHISNCVSLFSKCDVTPIKAININVKTPVNDKIIFMEDDKRQYKTPTTPHRILCEFKSSEDQKGESCATVVEDKTVKNKNGKKLKRSKDITEFFPVRRSVRKTKSVVKEEMTRNLENCIRTASEDGLMIQHFREKGRGIITSKQFQKGDFVVEYIGELIEVNDASEREKKYASDEKTGCYMYYFKYNNHQYCIDATAETGKLGRLVNHSRNGNLMTKVVAVDKRPHLVLIAKENIPIGTELTYDYGDRSKESLLHHPWLAL